MPWDRTLESWDPIVVLLLAVLGAGGAVLLLLLGSTAGDSQRFVRSPGFVPWAAVIAVQAAFWVVVAVPLWREVIHAYTRAKPARTIWVIPTVFVLLLGALAVLSPARGLDWPLVGHHLKVWILTGTAALGVGVESVFSVARV